MRKLLVCFLAILIALSMSACRRSDKLYDKAKAEICKDLPYPSSYKMNYVQKGRVPHIAKSGFIAVNSDTIYKIKYQAKDANGELVYCFAYVMFDNQGNIVGKEILPLEVPFVDELLGLNKKGGDNR